MVKDGYSDDVPRPILFVVDLGLAALRGDLLPILSNRCVKAPGKLRPRGVAINVDGRVLQKQLPL